MFTDKSDIQKEFRRSLSNLFGKPLEESSVADQYQAVARMIRDEVNERWVATNNRYLSMGERQVYYFSLEFLMGQFLESNLIYLGWRDLFEEALAEVGVKLDDLIKVEPDAGLGNGGLGRLAACFLDSLASTCYAGHGNGIRYKYGLFSQKVINGYQVELPDNWLRESNAWEIRKQDKSVTVLLGGNAYPVAQEDGTLKFVHENALRVKAVPYDIPILGYQNEFVNTLRLWSAEVEDDQPGFNFESFSRGDYINAVSDRYAVEAISEVLYPDDSNYKNRILRLKQQYFFVSAGLQSIVRRYKKKNNHSLSDLAKFVAIQINDTHPALAVPELMRILMDEEDLGWDEAWAITCKTIAYTNHTIMPEALEKWPVDTFRELLPRIYQIVEEINRRFCEMLKVRFPGDWDRVSRMAIIGDNQVRMANLAIVGSFSVNGVAAVHSELLKTHVLKDFYDVYPEKFNNRTNGITHRRWLLKSNPGLAKLLTSSIGEGWIKEPSQLTKFENFKNDTSVLDSLGDIRRKNKVILADIIKTRSGIVVDPDSIFDVQVKRIHAYKRQLLNVLHVLHLFFALQDGEDIGTPRTFIMAGKAAPSYYYAKSIIKLVSEVSSLIESDPKCKGKLSLVFLENYGIALAERIFPASDVSEQISTASKEASGTSNMKFMMNGAITIGTGDGANIEIHDQVGDENFLEFGLSVQEVLRYYDHGDYNSVAIYQDDPRLQRILDFIQNGITSVPVDEFSNIVRSLLDYNDEFFVLKDFDSYVGAHAKLESIYRTQRAWNKMSLMNIAKSGVFSSDHTIGEYANQIWRIQPAILRTDGTVSTPKSKKAEPAKAKAAKATEKAEPAKAKAAKTTEKAAPTKAKAPAKTEKKKTK
jgi:starch phosphorylase